MGDGGGQLGVVGPPAHRHRDAVFGGEIGDGVRTDPPRASVPPGHVAEDDDARGATLAGAA